MVHLFAASRSPVNKHNVRDQVLKLSAGGTKYRSRSGKLDAIACMSIRTLLRLNRTVKIWEE
jgi:hypothetical protein